MQAHPAHLDALRESETLLAWGSNSTGLITWSSPAWRRFTGISAEQQGKHRWQTCLHPEDENALHDGAEKRNRKDPELASEFRLLHHDGTFHPVLGYVGFPQNQSSSETGAYAACFEIQSKTKSDVAAVNAPEDNAPQPELPDDAFLTDEPIEFDHQALRDLFDNDADALCELAELFETTCEESLEFLTTGFTNPNQQDLFSTAHRLKGAVANINASQVLESCQQLEEAIRANEISTAEKLSQQVIRSVMELRDRVKQEFMT